MTGATGDLEVLRARLRAIGHPLHAGARQGVPVFASPEHAVLVLGPPRSGKTSSLIIPNVLMAAGAVVSTSTKPDVQHNDVADEALHEARRRREGKRAASKWD